MFNFGNLGQMMKEFQTMKENIERAKQELKNEKVVVEVGGGMIRVVANGIGDIVDIDITDTGILNDEKLLKELLISGVNEAIERSRELMMEKMAQASGLGLNLAKLGGLF